MHRVFRIASFVGPLAAGFVFAACGAVESDPVAPEPQQPSPPRPPVGDGPDDAAMPTTSRTCSAEELSQCRVGRCAVAGSSASLPPGAALELAEQPLEPALANDAIGSVVCTLTLPDGAGEVSLSIDLDAPVVSDLSMFRYRKPFAQRVDASKVAGSRLTALVTESGVYGVTARGGAVTVSGEFPSDGLSSITLADIVRNVTSSSIRFVAYDGTRLYVGSGARVLVYDGIPTSPGTKPMLVLGAPSLDAVLPGASASILQSPDAIWTNGQRLVVSDGNRVLIWNKVPTVSFAPADLVLGQQDFTTRTANFGGLSASTFNLVQGIDSDGTRLAVADLRNNRVLVWNSFPTTIGQPASSVVGQSSFTTDLAYPLYQAWGALFDGSGLFVAARFTGFHHFASVQTGSPPDYFPIPNGGPTRVVKTALVGVTSVARTASGGLAVSDPNGQRVAVLRSTKSSSQEIDFVLGQADSTRDVTHPVSASSISYDAKTFGSGGKLFVTIQSRLLVYDTAPTYHFEPASRVVGAAGFTTREAAVDYRRTSLRTLASASDVATNGSVVAVADRSNHRVLLYDAASLASTNAAAAVVLGQPDGTSFVANADKAAPTASTLSGPSGVALDGSRLIVADTENHRVLIWTPIPTASNTPATVVLGQSDFTTRRPNRGRGDENLDGFSDAAADGFFAPTGVATDGTRLLLQIA